MTNKLCGSNKKFQFFILVGKYTISIGIRHALHILGITHFDKLTDGFVCSYLILIQECKKSLFLKIDFKKICSSQFFFIFQPVF